MNGKDLLITIKTLRELSNNKISLLTILAMIIRGDGDLYYSNADILRPIIIDLFENYFDGLEIKPSDLFKLANREYTALDELGVLKYLRHIVDNMSEESQIKFYKSIYSSSVRVAFYNDKRILHRKPTDSLGSLLDYKLEATKALIERFPSLLNTLTISPHIEVTDKNVDVVYYVIKRTNKKLTNKDVFKLVKAFNQNSLPLDIIKQILIDKGYQEAYKKALMETML